MVVLFSQKSKRREDSKMVWHFLKYKYTWDRQNVWINVNIIQVFTPGGQLINNADNPHYSSSVWTMRQSEEKSLSNNLVKAWGLLLSDLRPALSVTLGGFQLWVIKRATQASGWERVYGCLEPNLKPCGGGGEDLFYFFPAHHFCLLSSLKS